MLSGFIFQKRREREGVSFLAHSSKIVRYTQDMSCFPCKLKEKIRDMFPQTFFQINKIYNFKHISRNWNLLRVSNMFIYCQSPLIEDDTSPFFPYFTKNISYKKIYSRTHWSSFIHLRKHFLCFTHPYFFFLISYAWHLA